MYEGLALAHLGVVFKEEEVAFALVARVEEFALIGALLLDSEVEGWFAGSAVAYAWIDANNQQRGTV